MDRDNVYFAVDGGVGLRRMRAADLPAFQACRADPDVGRFQDWKVMADGEAFQFLQAMSKIDVPKIGGWCQIAVVDIKNDSLIGDLGLHLSDDQSEAELGITLSTDAQGKSLGFAAVSLVVDWIFANTPATKIVAITDERNTGAQRLLKRLGWPQVGTLGPEVEIEGLTEFVYEKLRV